MSSMYEKNKNFLFTLVNNLKKEKHKENCGELDKWEKTGNG